MPRCLLAASLLALAAAAPAAHAQISLAGGTYTQDFDALASSGTSSALPAGWLLSESGTGANALYSAGTGSLAAGDTYSFGSGGSGERAFGGLQSGSVNPTIGACFTNATGATITTLQVAYTGEQWRSGNTAAARDDRLDAQLNASPGSASLTATGTWSDIDALDFTSPVRTSASAGALDGNAAANRSAISATIGGLAIADGALFCLRWTDFNPSGSDDGLGIDDFSLAVPAGTPALSVGDAAAAEGDGGTTTLSFTVSLSQPAPAGGVSFDLATADATATAGSDYVARALSGASIAPGASAAVFEVTVQGDTVVEPDETFFVNATSVVGATVLDAQGTGTVINDDAAASPDLQVDDVAVQEGDAGTTTARFTVRLATPAPAGGVTFDIATADGSAVAGSDYVARAAAGLSIAPGSSSATFDVAVIGDSVVEPTETFAVNVTNVTGATVVDAQGIATITDNDVPLTPIHAVQGSGTTSPIVGSVVTVEGIVTARKFNSGFFLQSSDTEIDADPMTAEAVFVFTGGAPPAAAAVGNRVRLTGSVVEFAFSDTTVAQQPLTQLGGIGGLSVVSTGNPLPTAAPIEASLLAPGAARDALERFEGMRVSVGPLVVVAPTNANIAESSATATPGNGVFFATAAGVPRPLREPGLDPDEIVTQSAPGSIPRFDGNPELLRVDSDGQIGATRASADAGATLPGLVGVLDYAFAYYSLLPDAGQLDAASLLAGTPTAVPEPSADMATVGGFNILRFFDAVNDPGISEPVLSAAAFDRRLDQTTEAICRYVRLPDVLGVVEVENLNALTQLADRINASGVAGSRGCPFDPRYVPYLVEGNDVGGIDVGFLVSTREVRPGVPRVRVVEVAQVGKDTVFTNPDGSTERLNDRPPLVLRAVIEHPNGASESFTIVNNHLRSLGGVADTAAGSAGWATAGARVRAKRGQQAVFLAELVQQRQVSDPTERLLLLGDFNVFEFNDGLVDGMGIITGRPAPASAVLAHFDSPVATPLTVLTPLSPRDQQYSFVFDGNAQSLDHAVVNQRTLDSLLAVKAEHARINADFAETRFGTGPLRVSDHDPVVLQLTAASFRSVDLRTTASAARTPVAPGEALGWTVTVASRAEAAPAAALTLSVDAALPGLAVTAPPGWTCEPVAVAAGSTASTCRRASFAAGASASFGVALPQSTGLAARTYTLTATAGSAGTETVAADNTASAGVVLSAVPPANRAPDAAPDAFATPAGTALVVGAPGVLGNDVDPDGDALLARVVAEPAGGSLRLAADGGLRYVPTPGFTGSDRFTYEACDALACTRAEGTIAVAPAPGRFGARDDRAIALENRSVDIPVLANDAIDDPALASARIEVVQPPAFGRVAVSTTGGLPPRAAIALRYAPPADFSGEDLMAYRLCDAAGRCSEAAVQVVVRPVPEAALTIESTGTSGRRDIDVSGVRALGDARYAVTPAVPARRSEALLGADASHETPWDGAEGRAIQRIVLPRSAAPRQWRVLVEADSLSGGNVDLYLGVDADGDGDAARGELRCAAARPAGGERCELVIDVPANAEGAYWTLLHAADGAAQTARIAVYEVPVLPGSAALVATGPATAGRLAPWPLRLAWNDPLLLDGETRVAYLSLAAGPDQPAAWMPVSITRRGGAMAPLPLVPVADAGLALADAPTLRLGADEQADRVFVDVPAGTRRMLVGARSSEPLTVELRLAPAPAPSAAAPTIGAAQGALLATLDVPGSGVGIVTPIAAPAAGRLHLVLRNRGAAAASVTLAAQIDGEAPRVRSGSYFNPARGGHGLFVYPAGDQWAGLWFTYLQDGSPTWYYLQGPAPGADGRFRAEVFRSTWNGRRNTLTAVGEAHATPTAADAFSFTYTLDGETGSEPFASFGRGCPSVGGVPVDASGNWFDPARAGSGYSVQLFPGYEFLAVFAYDAAGVARFLVAERSGAPTAEATLALEQLRGFCPLCARGEAPARATVGTLQRSIGGGRLQRIATDARFVGGVPGAWASDDRVQPLGLTQGCALP
mgnify:FL=1